MPTTRTQPDDVRINEDLKLLSETLEDVLKFSGDRADEAWIEIRKNAEQALADVKERLGTASESYYQRAKDAACQADGYVRDNPWHGVGIGATVGLVLGLLLARH
ncbi:stress response protein ElaB [Affinibrenneria salicis]|uniref:Stress response protein ElaB n=1 Tax=Affinibrenneria salicis TaxID=2590031 RepID=A0A5J5FW75_9GAMM|nr:stress response protein ElaB [Affinibrenneria salicis]KAA8997030.1 stress response protein ElaB [Affinibrenneria salicis]